MGLIGSVDCNNLTQGVFLANGRTDSHFPSSVDTWFVIAVTPHNSFTLQICAAWDMSGIYSRTFSPEGWSAWKEL